MRTIVAANPNSGSSDQSEQIAELATGLGWSWHWTTCEADATAIAAEAGPDDRVVAAGGDGTVHAVVRGLMSVRAPAMLGALPLGTGNDLVRTLGLSLDPEQALRELHEADGAHRAIDVVRAELGGVTRHMINSSAGGMSVEVDRIVEPESKARWGPLAYVLGAIDLIGDMPEYDLAVRIGGQLVDHVRCIGFVATNGPTVGGGLQVAPTADPEDGLLDLLVVESGPKVALAALGAQLKTGGVLSSPLAHHHVGARIELVCARPMPFNLDGEIVGEYTEAALVVLPRALRASVGPGYLYARRSAPSEVRV